jgi:hypothetical protein
MATQDLKGFSQCPCVVNYAYKLTPSRSLLAISSAWLRPSLSPPCQIERVRALEVHSEVRVEEPLRTSIRFGTRHLPYSIMVCSRVQMPTNGQRKPGRVHAQMRGMGWDGMPGVDFERISRHPKSNGVAMRTYEHADTERTY